ncbi:MAG: PEP/pyruvate-binding domain-containing protein, partial [Nanoarchaeota archaeon]|nr:PEP/pyruvate-binding domain-containing protein [Nanoarchaeota archaeon]
MITLEKNIAWLKDLNKDSIPLVGGKGANLAEMYNIHLPVPPAFIVTAAAFKKHIEDTKINKIIFDKLEFLDVNNNPNLQTIAKQLQDLLIQTPMTQDLQNEIIESYDALSTENSKDITSNNKACFVAVRSSATAEDLPSISKEEHVLVKIDEKPFFGTIEELYTKIGDGRHNKIEVPAMKDNKLIWAQAEQIYKHPAKSDKLYKIITETGREVTITNNHSLIILDKETLKPKTIKITDLSDNEYIPVINKLPLIKNKLLTINTLDYIKGEDVIVKDKKIFIKNNSKNWKIQNSLPTKLKLNKNLAYFLGIYLAEGSTYENNCITITNTKKEIIEEAIKFFKEINIYNNQKINKSSLRVYCKALVRFLHATTGKPLNIKRKGKSCYIKRVPDFIFGANKELIKEFLAGCFDGDGHVGKDSISYSSTSKTLTSGIIKLLEMIEYKIYYNKKTNGSYQISIAITDCTKFINEIPLKNKEKIKSLNKLVKSYSERKQYPKFKSSIPISNNISNLLREEFEKDKLENLYIAHCPECNKKIEKTSYNKKLLRYHCKDCKKVFYEKDILKSTKKGIKNFDNKGRFIKKSHPWNKAKIEGTLTESEFLSFLKKHKIKKYSNFFNNSIKWDKIKEIKPINYTGWVYDFTVPNIENFASGVGGIITHNTASFAGQQATFLNIKSPKELIKAVKDCWASLYTARAIFYRVTNKFPHEKVFIAVVVQKMVNSQIAGIMFTVNPVTENDKEILIESSYGLGEAVVSGSITPDEYIVDKSSIEVKSKNIVKKTWAMIRNPETGENLNVDVPEDKQSIPSLSNFEAKKLAEYGLKIEQHYNKPQDIEFALENSKIYITQSRPITTLGKKDTQEEKLEELKGDIELKDANLIVSGIPASPGIGKGRVVIVRDIQDLSKIKQGNVLVARMTNPDYVSAMGRASAIVTDSGGSTAHAAIVSREMGIPCFSGDTKILTQTGFENLKEIWSKIANGEKIYTLSFNKISLRVEWKEILNATIKKADTITISTSKNGKVDWNLLTTTNNHPFLTIKNRNASYQTISSILRTHGIIYSTKKIPIVNNSIQDLEIEKAMVCGAIFSDGYLRIQKDGTSNTTFIQKDTPHKQKYIKSIYNAFSNVYDYKLRPVNRDYHYCYRKHITEDLQKIRSELPKMSLSSNQESLLHFLGTFIDGDGNYTDRGKVIKISFNARDLNILQALVILCLRLEINYRILKEDNQYRFYISSESIKLSSYLNRVETNEQRRK